MERRQAAAALAALAHPLRLGLSCALVAAGPVGLTPGVIRDAMPVPPATLSFHLRQLIATGLATQSRSGRPGLSCRARSARPADRLPDGPLPQAPAAAGPTA